MLGGGVRAVAGAVAGLQEQLGEPGGARLDVIGGEIAGAGCGAKSVGEQLGVGRVGALDDFAGPGPVQLAQSVLLGMRKQRWGKIVNLSSMGGKLVFPGGGYYHATKFAIEAL